MNAASFVEFALENEALQFGEFTLKSGRISPYFFNAGKFNQGAAFNALGRYYASTLIQAGISFDLLFGPAYKGIPLATAASIALDSQYQRSVGVTFNRKEAKTHGEAGKLIGAPLAGRIVIVDDVITAGTAIRESMDLIQEAGAEPAAVLVALDRQEKGPEGKSAIQEIEKAYNIPVLAIAKLQDLLEFAKTHDDLSSQLEQLTSYRQTYGID
jgi:orotate phosphoribosyltransferase|tara:strand:+ start:550 stop:1188 length:639 start_codon:yes stop_codon:yes gene_type:complete